MDSSAATPTNKPIFVVGSPRSGTSILTWCLGQHPNMFALPESAWMGDFAIDLGIRYQIGTARGNRSVLSAMHIVRDVTSVVRSMLNFRRVAESSLVANEQEAYNYWLRTVSSCLLAERAYGPRVVFRLRYSDLVDTPEAALRSLSNFLSEPFAAECLTPLQKRINSSNVRDDFKIGDPETDPSLVEQAMRLSTEVEKTPQPPEASPGASDEMEAAFNERISEYCNAPQVIAALQKRAERLAQEIKGKRAIIQHLRARRQRYKLRRWCFGQDSDKHRNGWWSALRESFRRRRR